MKKVLLLVIGLYSCSGSSDENVEKAIEYGCENKLAMVQADSSLPSISFELSDSIEQAHHKLDTAFINDCGPYFPFKWQNKVYQDLKLTLFDPTRCIFLSDRFSVSIRINKAGLVLLADSIVTQDLKLISSYVTKHLVANYGDRERPGDIELTWQEGSQIDHIEDAIDQAIEGYLAAAEIVSQKSFNNGICDLEVENLEKLQTEFPFILIISHTRKEFPPPPHSK